MVVSSLQLINKSFFRFYLGKRTYALDLFPNPQLKPYYELNKKKQKGLKGRGYIKSTWKSLRQRLGFYSMKKFNPISKLETRPVKHQ